MELLQYKADMFGRKILVGVNWEFLWIPVAAGLAVVAVHLVIRQFRK